MYLELREVKIFMTVQLLVDGIPAHRLLDDVVVVGYLVFVHRRLEIALTVVTD